MEFVWSSSQGKLTTNIALHQYEVSEVPYNLRVEAANKSLALL